MRISLLAVLSIALASSSVRAQDDACEGQPRVEIQYVYGAPGHLITRWVSRPANLDDGDDDMIVGDGEIEPLSLEWLGHLDRDPYLDAILFLGGCGNHGDCVYAAVAGCGDGTFRIVSSPDYAQSLRVTDRWVSGWRELAAGYEYTCDDESEGWAGGVHDVYLVRRGARYVQSGRSSPRICRDLPERPPRRVPRQTIEVDPAQLEHDRSVVSDLVRSPDGSRLLWIGEHSRVLDASGRTIALLESPAAQRGVWLPDARAVAVCDQGGSIRFADPTDGRTLATIERAVHGGCSALAASPDGRRLAAVGHFDGSLTIWDTTTRAIVRSQALPGAAGQPDRVSVEDDGRAIVTTFQGAVIALDPGAEPRVGRWSPRIFDLVREGSRLYAFDGMLATWVVSPGAPRPIVAARDPPLVIDAELGPRDTVAWCRGDHCAVQRLHRMPEQAIESALAGRPPSVPLASVRPDEDLLDIPLTADDAARDGVAVAVALGNNGRTLYVGTTTGRLLTFPIPAGSAN